MVGKHRPTEQKNVWCKDAQAIANDRSVRHHDLGFIVSGDRIMVMLFAIGAVIVLMLGLFAWRYEAATVVTGGIAKLLQDRLVLAPLRGLELTQPEIQSR